MPLWSWSKSVVACGVVGAAGAAAGCGASAERSAPSTSWAQWIFIGGSAPSGAERSAPDIESASSTVFPAISSVATLATAIAVSQPKV